MPISKDFLKALRGLFYFTLFFILCTILMTYIGYRGIKLDSPSAFSIIINQFVFSVLPTIALWVAIGFVTKDRQAASIALAIALLGKAIIMYKFITLGGPRQFYPGSYTPILFINLSTYLAFGYLHFRQFKGIYLGAIFLILTGINFAGVTPSYYEFTNNIFRFIGLKDFLEIQIPTGQGNGYRILNLFNIVANSRFTILSFLIFWSIYNWIKDENFDLSLRSIPIPQTISNFHYSIIYWVMRLSLIITIFGFSIMTRGYLNRLSTIDGLFRILCFCFAIFVIGSIYRNFLTAFFISKGDYPKGWFFALNIPLIHPIAWIRTLFLKAPAPDSAEILKQIQVEQETALSKASALQDRYKKGDRNNPLKVVLILFLVLNFFYQFMEGINSVNAGNSSLLILSFLVSFSLVIWYFSDAKALFLLFGIQSFLLLGFSLTGYHSLQAYVPVAGLLNMVLFYALFHFDRFLFKEETTS